MFDMYLVVDGSLRNEINGNDVSGYSVDVRIAYYRGLGLSMVDVALEVDGEPVRTSDITFTVHGNSYRADAMGEILDDRWGFTEAATLTVARPGGLTAGEHSVHFTERLRVSYAPAPSETHDTKTLVVA